MFPVPLPVALDGMGRREALRILSAGALAARGLSAAGQDLRFGGLDRVEFFVSDLGKAVAFYTQVFGNALFKNNRTEKRYLKLGSTYISMDQGPAPLRVDHFAAGIEDFQMPRLHSFLDQQGIAYKDYPSGRDLYFLDPDGTRIQLGTINSWNLMGNTASPEASPSPSSATRGDPIFNATGLDHVLLNVSDPEKSALFYAKVFGPVTQRNNNRIWFQVGKSRIGLLKTPDGQRLGVNHYCVAAAAFDYTTVVKKLALAGAKVESPEVASAPEFRDPDGFLIQVMGRR